MASCRCAIYSLVPAHILLALGLAKRPISCSLIGRLTSRSLSNRCTRASIAVVE